MEQANDGTWRVVDESGAVHEVTLKTRRNGWLAEGADDDGVTYYTTQRLAVLSLAVERQWMIAEVLESGERSRAELLAVVREYFESGREYDEVHNRAGHSPLLAKRCEAAEAALLALVGGAP